MTQVVISAPQKVFRDNQLGLNYAEMMVEARGSDKPNDPLFGFSVQLSFPYRILTKKDYDDFRKSWADKTQEAEEVIKQIKSRQAIGVYTNKKVDAMVDLAAREFQKNKPRVKDIII